MSDFTNRFNMNVLIFDRKLVSFGLIILFLEMIYHILTMKYLFSEGIPIFSMNYIVESFVIFLGLFIFFLGIIKGKILTLNLFTKRNGGFEKYSVYLTLSLSILFVTIFVLDPISFGKYSLEDNIIEWLSALLLFASSFLFLFASIKYSKTSSIIKLNLWIFYFLSLTFFVLAMEEISWFQRVLDIETPENSVFKHNNQNELNIHNFATNYLENLYYFGSFLFLVFLPFIGLIFKDVLKQSQISMFIPRPFIAIIGSVFCSYNYDMWNIIFTQYAFFSALIILFYYMKYSPTNQTKIIILFTSLLIIISQFLFIFYGDNFVRIWEVTEYKEFLIPFGFLIYALNLSLCKTEKEVESIIP